jgi:hypothetical protein
MDYRFDRTPDGLIWTRMAFQYEFFWSHYLSGTADQLEIILFLVGLVIFTAGSLACASHGAQPALPSRTAIDALLPSVTSERTRRC